MMTFNLFGKKEKETNGRVFVDKTYISTAAKMNACLELARTEPDAVFIAWFAETAKEFKEFFARNGIEENRVMEARFIHTPFLQHRKPVFTEHYPLHNKETELVKNWPQEQLLVFSAMDEPLFKHFGSEKMIPLMKMLGMKESESIEHSLVSKSIIKGQEKIATQVIAEQSAASQAEWMKRNIK